MRLRGPEVEGGFALLGSTLMMCLALHGLRMLSVSAEHQVLLLAGGNLILGISSLCSRARRMEGLHLRMRGVWGLSLWAAGYCATYSVFLLFPRFISLPSLLIARAISPFVAARISPLAFECVREAKGNVWAYFGLATLFGLVVIQASSGEGLTTVGMVAALVCSFCTSQFGATLVAVDNAGKFPGGPLGLLSAGGLAVVAWVCGDATQFRGIGFEDLLLCVVISGAIWVIQSLYVFGLNKASSRISALALATSVPFSILIQICSGEGYVSIAEICLTGLYLVATVVSVCTGDSQAQTVQERC